MKKKPIKHKKIILGLVGELASGKDTIAAYLKKKYHGETISFSQPLRDILDRLYLPQTRENMAWLGINLRKLFGQDILAKVIMEQVEKSKNNIITLPNVRLPQDIVYLSKLPNFYLIHIDAEPKIRYSRLIKRSQNADDKTKTWQQFLKDSKLPTEIQIRRLAKKTKLKLDNNGDFNALYGQIEKMLREMNPTPL